MINRLSLGLELKSKIIDNENPDSLIAAVRETIVLCCKYLERCFVKANYSRFIELLLLMRNA